MSTEVKDTEPSQSSEIRRNVRERLLLPLGIPVVAAIVVALLGVSFSRVFLAGHGQGHEGAAEAVVEEASKSSAPVMWATIITIIVLFGAAGISLMKSMRSTSFGLLAVGAVVLVVVSGSVLAGAGDVKAETVDFGRPTAEEIGAADPANKVEIDALSSNLFQAKEFFAKPGIVRVDYVGKGGTHRLKIRDARFNWFDLVVNNASIASGDIKLDAGTYYVFCPIPGHEQAGMYADLVVK
ncbi:MAG TPA: sulfocyanin-like copper-binding protein [Acidimicrobiia bacterium]|nr:sulfocyanin-like copper-binding protein [Acidimicrobiia bacterium]